MPAPSLTLTVLPDTLAVCQLPAGSALPAWATSGRFWALLGTDEELSVVCLATAVPAGVKQETGWRALRFEGPFDFALTGILAAVAAPLAEAAISIFALSTFNTDYVLVRQTQLEAAMACLKQAGHVVN